MKRLIALAVSLSLSSSLGGLAGADGPRPADEAFVKGHALSNEGRLAEACAAFELSQRLDPQSGTKFNLADCYEKTNRIASAWILYRELSRTDAHPQRRAGAAQIAKVLEPQVPRIAVRVYADPAAWGMRIFVGKTEVTSLLGTGIPFDPGTYVVEGYLPGHPPFSETVTVGPAATHIVDVRFAPPIWRATRPASPTSQRASL